MSKNIQVVVPDKDYEALETLIGAGRGRIADLMRKYFYRLLKEAEKETRAKTIKVTRINPDDIR
jgi:hypothetical protein